jgi:hypothetical protein
MRHVICAPRHQASTSFSAPITAATAAVTAATAVTAITYAAITYAAITYAAITSITSITRGANRAGTSFARTVISAIITGAFSIT